MTKCLKIRNIYSGEYSNLYVNTPHDVTTFEIVGIVVKKLSSWEQNIKFSVKQKKSLNCALKTTLSEVIIFYRK